MSCTTVLVGKRASNDGSTMIARTDDGRFDVKKMVVVLPKDQPRKYKSVISHAVVELPEEPLRYTACPNVDPKKEGIWAATGINAANVGMTATETITSNPRVLSADPLVKYEKANGRKKEVPGGLGEEDFVVLVLPYIRSAREGVLRLAGLLEKYGTYESNGIAFNDRDEIWWMETIGGHHWMARKVPDEAVVLAPNQFGMDSFDLEDAFGEQKAHLCSADLREFIAENHLDCNQNSGWKNNRNTARPSSANQGNIWNSVSNAVQTVAGNQDKAWNPRDVFGSRGDSDHIYNTPRAWHMGRYLASRSLRWDGADPRLTPESDDLPWCLVPDRKVAVEDVIYLLSAHYQGTDFDPYIHRDTGKRGMYRSIGINRTGVTSICQIRPEGLCGVEWVAFGSTTFSAFVPVYPNVPRLPAYLSKVTEDVSTENLYWSSRLLDALSDMAYGETIREVERYHSAVLIGGRRRLLETDRRMAAICPDPVKAGPEEAAELEKIALAANADICQMAKEETTKALGTILQKASEKMRNGFKLSDN